MSQATLQSATWETPHDQRWAAVEVFRRIPDCMPMTVDCVWLGFNSTRPDEDRGQCEKRIAKEFGVRNCSDLIIQHAGS